MEMTIKKYLKTPEEILALKDTDTKLYKDNYCGYFKFVGGVPCFFSTASDVFFNTEIDFSQKDSKLYIEVEEPVKEADENDVGKLCAFCDEENQLEQIAILKRFEPTLTQMRYTSSFGSAWKYCRRLTPEEVAEITGYKVEG